jgi:N-acyl-phosphatidylethanolamine-hydrolysing phospholipase D
MPSFRDILKLLLYKRDSSEDVGIVSPPYVPVYAEPDLNAIRDPDPQRIQLTWVGHSTFLIQVGGVNILTDPIWSDRASPVSFLGPKRVARPGVRFEDLPKIDLVLISHTHYDHLDRPTVLRLDNEPHYIVSSGIAKWFAREGITNVSEHTWWEKEMHGGIFITAVPAQHWSKRGLIGTDGAGAGGFVIETPRGNIYFAGDTGYNNKYFKEIGERFGNISLSLLPIGAYDPRWFMQRFHLNPPEAIRVHQEVHSKRSIGMHWGTIPLTIEPLAEPPLYLAREAGATRLPDDAFTIMGIGETRIF